MTFLVVMVVMVGALTVEGLAVAVEVVRVS